LSFNHRDMIVAIIDKPVHQNKVTELVNHISTMIFSPRRKRKNPCRNVLGVLSK
jgi:hypothetical protein